MSALPPGKHDGANPIFILFRYGQPMLATLRSHHDDVLRRIDALETLLGDAEPDLSAVASARVALTRASRARTAYLENTIYPALLRGGPVAAITELRGAGRERLAHSSEHIARWTVGEIGRRWNDYRKASDAMRATMRERIRLEQRLVYPLIAD